MSYRELHRKHEGQLIWRSVLSVFSLYYAGLMTQHCQSCIYQLYLTYVAIAHAQEYLTVSGAISLALRRKWAVLIHENNIFCAVNFEHKRGVEHKHKKATINSKMVFTHCLAFYLFRTHWLFVITTPDPIHKYMSGMGWNWVNLANCISKHLTLCLTNLSFGK